VTGLADVAELEEIRLEKELLGRPGDVAAEDGQVERCPVAKDMSVAAFRLFEISSSKSRFGMACPMRYEYRSFKVGRRVLRANVKCRLPDWETE
jgi:hypothetical protein